MPQCLRGELQFGCGEAVFRTTRRREAPSCGRYTAASPPHNSAHHRRSRYQAPSARPARPRLFATKAVHSGTTPDGPFSAAARTSRSRCRPKDTRISATDSAASQSGRKTQSSAVARGSSSTPYRPVSTASPYHSIRAPCGEPTTTNAMQHRLWRSRPQPGWGVLDCQEFHVHYQPDHRPGQPSGNRMGSNVAHASRVPAAEHKGRS